MKNICIKYYNSPIGWLEVAAGAEGIESLGFVEVSGEETGESIEELDKCIEQLEEYFAGHRKNFDIKVNLTGTEFQNKVWNYLLLIPFGETESYVDVANALGDRKAVRAVGTANNRNKIAIIVPCHRVIGKDGSLTGYASGVHRKEWLLNHEGARFNKNDQIELF